MPKFLKQKPTVEFCEWPECNEPPQYPAPKSRYDLDYLWFCKQHVSDYNKSWNFFQGMSEEQIHNYQKNNSFGQKLTWKGVIHHALYHQFAELKENPQTVNVIYSVFDDPFFELTQPRNIHNQYQSESKYTKLIQKQPVLQQALKLLDIQEHDYAHLNFKYVKKQFNLQVKRYHPDRNPEANKEVLEHKLKKIIEAFGIIKDYMYD